MGLFDIIHYNGNFYQTKDFDEPYMDHYYIEDGRLFSSVGHSEDRSPATKWKQENPGKQLPKELAGLLGMWGCATWVETGRKDLNFHGVLNFYKYHDQETPPR